MENTDLEVYKSELLLNIEKITKRDWTGDVMDTGLIVIYAPSSRTEKDGRMSEQDISILEEIFEEVVSEYGFIIPCIEEKRSEIFNKVKKKV